MTDDLLRELETLRAGFLERLPERLEDIASQWQRLQAMDVPKGAARKLLMEVHGIAGTAGSLGVAAVSTAARTMEDVVDAVIKGRRAPDDADRGRMAVAFAAALEALRQAVDRDVSVDLPRAVTVRPPHADSAAGPVFVLDDDLEQAHELCLQLTHYGFVVRELTTLADLEQALETERPAALLMDILFPGGEIGGPDIVRRLRLDAGLDAPVLFISARSDIQARLAAVRAGCAGYFTKPASAAAVIEALDRLTRRGLDPYRVLVVDDEPEVAAFHAAALTNAGFVVDMVTEPLSVMPHLVEFRPDLILMDVYMPACSGPELAAVIRQEEAFIGIPIVFLSSERDRLRQIAAMGQGGDDFFTKPVQVDQLIGAIAARAQRGRALRSQIERDGLTGLLTHSRIVEQLEMTVRLGTRQGSVFAVAMVDIDGFKGVNDSHGHLAGDQVLKSLAFLLRQRLRMTDVIGRFGGDEYTIILPDASGQAAVDKMDEVRQHFAAITHQRGPEEFALTLSCGVAEFPAYDAAHSLITAADTALYEAKRGGRNRVVLAGGGTP